MKSLLLLVVMITFLVNPVLVSYASAQYKTHTLLTDGYIQGKAEITCWDYDGGPKTHVKVDVTKAAHQKGGKAMSAFIVDLTKNGPNSYIQIGKPVVPKEDYDYIAFSDSFDSKDFRTAEPEQGQEGGTEESEKELAGNSAVTIQANSIKTFVNTDKKEYSEGESATIFLGFIDADDNFVDPDSISADFNGAPISEDLEKKKVGSYTFVTPALQRGHNQITVIPAKAGFNTEVEAVTITVTTTGSVGFPSTANNDSCPIGDVGRIVVVVGTSPPSDEDTLSEGDVDIIAASTSGTAEMGVL